MNTSSVLSNILDMTCARRCADAAFQWYATSRTRKLDHISIAKTQTETLLKLVDYASDTQFGREHDFKRIRSLADYRERVPLREYDAFWSEYWQGHYPDMENVTWPGQIPWFALSSGTTSGTTKYIPVSRAMMASNQKAALTALAWHQNQHQKSRLFSGKMFFLGGSTALEELGSRDLVLAGDLSGIAAREAPSLLRAFAFPPHDIAFHSDWETKVQLLADRSANLPITMISGVPSWLLVLFDRLRKTTGKATISEIWPELQLVIHGGTSFEPYRSLFKKIIGNDAVRFLETYPASEGFVAAEDLRYGRLRVIPDHNIFFEFVPVDELQQANPTRHSLAEVVPGVQYAIVLTTCAGLWSYVLGDTVCFESRDPALMRFTGRTRQSLSAFGEHLIGEEIEKAVSRAAELSSATVSDFNVGPVFPIDGTGPGYHHFLVEFVDPPAECHEFSRRIDEALCEFNEDYRAHRSGNVGMQSPKVSIVRRGGFAGWMQSKGKLGGQHKVPRIDNTGQLTWQIANWFESNEFIE